MAGKLTATNSIIINAPRSKVWQALIDPDQIRKYLFGTNAVSDWKKGSDITYTGVWEGKPYTDKGKILEIEPEVKLHTTYLSGMSGKEDRPENYANVIYELSDVADKTNLTIIQDNIDDEQSVEHMKENWGAVLANMKKMLEQ